MLSTKVDNMLATKVDDYLKLTVCFWWSYLFLSFVNISHWLNLTVIFCICRVNIQIWIRIVSSCSSCAFVGFCSWMEWQMGWIWWAVLVSWPLLFLYNLLLSIFLILQQDLTNAYFAILSYRYIALFVVSIVCYVATFAFSGLLFHWFTPSGQDCGLNTFFIVLTLIFVIVFAIVALHPAVSLCICIALYPTIAIID